MTMIVIRASYSLAAFIYIGALTSAKTRPHPTIGLPLLACS